MIVSDPVGFAAAMLLGAVLLCIIILGAACAVSRPYAEWKVRHDRERWTRLRDRERARSNR